MGDLLVGASSRGIVDLLFELALPIVNEPKDRPRGEIETFLPAWETLELYVERIALARLPSATAARLDLPVEWGRAPGLCAAVTLGLARARVEAKGPRYPMSAQSRSSWRRFYGEETARHVAAVERGSCPPLGKTLKLMYELTSVRRGATPGRGRPRRVANLSTAVERVIATYGFEERLDLTRIAAEVDRLRGGASSGVEVRALKKALRADRIRWLQAGERDGMVVYWMGLPTGPGGGEAT